MFVLLLLSLLYINFMYLDSRGRLRRCPKAAAPERCADISVAVCLCVYIYMVEYIICYIILYVFVYYVCLYMYMCAYIYIYIYHLFIHYYYYHYYYYYYIEYSICCIIIYVIYDITPSARRPRPRSAAPRTRRLIKMCPTICMKSE